MEAGRKLASSQVASTFTGHLEDLYYLCFLLTLYYYDLFIFYYFCSHFSPGSDQTTPEDTVHRDHADQVLSIGMSMDSAGFFRGKRLFNITELGPPEWLS